MSKKISFYSILLLFVISSLAKGSDQKVQVYIKEDDDYIYPIYINGSYYQSWQTMGKKFPTCTHSSIAMEYADVEMRTFWVTNSEKEKIAITHPKIMSTSNVLKPKISIESNTIQPGETGRIDITYHCDNNMIMSLDLNGWAYIEVSAFVGDEKISFNFVKICTMENKSYDYSIVFALITAVIVVAAFTKVKDTMFKEELQNQDEIQPMHILFFVVFASIMLVIIFYFSKYLANIFNIFFGFSAVSSITMLLTHVLEDRLRTFGCLFKVTEYKFIGKVKPIQMIAASVSFSLVLCWFFTHNWLLNNIIGLSMVFLIFRIIKLPSFKVGFLLLVALFAYDIFWVFFSTPIFGKSVMVEAATAIDIPNKIVIPYFGDTPSPRCSLLGLGDMVLPGLFVTYCFRFGLFKRTNLYYETSILAYAIGLALCGVFLVIFKHGQPALLYINPALILMAVFVAKRRGELKTFWDGLPANANLNERVNYSDEIQLTSVE